MNIHMKFITFILIIPFILTSCGDQDKTEKTQSTDQKEEMVVPHDTSLVVKPVSWIKTRVSEAKNRLLATEGGKLMWQAMEAHGGLYNWFNEGALSFRFDYLGGQNRVTVQQVDQWSNKSVHQSVEDPEDQFGWNGQQAWVLRNDTLNFPFNPRFWALTPYYFLAQPFVFDGAGVNIEKAEDRELFGEMYDVVHITFDSGVGDSPDDYYYIYFDKETHLLKAIRYIVSYAGFFKNGEHSPETVMVLNNYETFNDIIICTNYTAYATDESNNITHKVTEVKVSEFEFLPNLKNQHFRIPENAILQNNL